MVFWLKKMTCCSLCGVDFMLLLFLLLFIFINFVKGVNIVHKAALWPQTSDMNTNKAFKVFLNQITVQKKSTVVGNNTMTGHVIFPLPKDEW